MAWFRYKAMTTSGGIVSGRIEAANVADLEGRLARLRLDLIDGHEQPNATPFGGGVSRRALIHFCFHLEQLCTAGVPLIDALADLRDSVTQPQFQAVLAAMVESVQGGKRLSEAMACHPRVFDAVVINLIRAGEDSGKLPEILASLVDSLKWQDELAAQARRLAIYPAILAAVTLGLLLFTMMYLVPKLTGFMRSMGQELPWHTEVLIAVSGFLIDNALILGGAAAVVFIAFRLALRRSAHARYAWDSAKLRLPLLGNILRKIILARFASVLALLYGAGISVLDAIRATENIVGNEPISQGLRRAHALISAGETIAAAFEHIGLFPPLVIRMLRVGENTGALDKALANVSYFFNRDVREAVERIQAMLEPAIVAIIGSVIGWIMLSVLGPIYDLVAKLGV